MFLRKGLARSRSLLMTLFPNHVILLDLVDGLALPVFIHFVSKLLPVSAPVVLVENLLLALLVLNVSLSLSSRS